MRRTVEGGMNHQLARKESSPVSKNAPVRPITVSLLSPHPGELAGLKRLLSSREFKVKALRTEFGPAFNPAQIRFSHTAVYVVDASSARPEIRSLIEAIRERVPKARVVVVKETLKDERLFPYLRLGARGFVRYADVHHELTHAIRVVAEGGFWLSGSQLGRFLDSLLARPQGRAQMSGPALLSRREREVLTAILQGFSNKEIGDKLHISERTVKFHVSKLLAKFRAQRRSDLIVKHYQLWPVPS